MPHTQSEFLIEHIGIADLNYSVILKYCSSLVDTNKRGFFDIYPKEIKINRGVFSNSSSIVEFPFVSLIQNNASLILSCNCKNVHKNLCEHMSQVLYNVMDRSYLRIFFDTSLRLSTIQKVAIDYGLEQETNLDDYFQIVHLDKSIDIIPLNKEIFPVNRETNDYLASSLLPNKTFKPTIENNKLEKNKVILVLRKHKYYDQLNVEILESALSKEGKIKNPLTPIDPLDLILKTENIEEAKFFTVISKFQQNFKNENTEADMEGLKRLVNNPLNLPVYYHDQKLSESMTASSLVQVQLKTIELDLLIKVDLREPFYEVSGELIANDKLYPLKTINIKYDCFIQIGNTLNLVKNYEVLKVLAFFKQNNPKILIHTSKYDEFRQQILSKLEDQISIRYSYIKPATQKQIIEQGLSRDIEKIIYLSDEKDFVSITPVVRYGNVEIPLYSKRQIHDTDQNGNVFKVERDNELEIHFTSIIMRQHPDFAEQVQEGNYFYLHKEKFLDENWFLDTFDEWRNLGIVVLGFNEIRHNRLNQHKAVISLNVVSGIDWFTTNLSVQFGNQKPSLKQLHKSIRNKSKFVQLDDGSLGILPEEWMNKFIAYFRMGEVIDDLIRTPKSNFAEISEHYDKEVLDANVKQELANFSEKLANFESIKEIEVPSELNATLRDYQKQGLNWLNFLDDFNFGACLADDMGLGKTIQIIAFILTQRNKRPQNTNLIVIPTSLVFNWEDELSKFAPSIKTFTYYGTNRVKNSKEFENYEIIITTYGMLISDIHYLKDFHFNYIILDESQAIKNPESQRYKAARMLKSRNKIVLTGTPIENNTFDIYGQLSFACPGLLGNKQYFKDIYSIPIDRFDDNRRARELQKKISPFILRRTKKQVAKELPEKTEMIIYCEMGDEQRKLYNTYEKELRDYISTKNEDEISQNSMHILTGLTKLRQICNSPSLLNEDEHFGDSSSKIEVLLEQIENKTDEHKILVFSQFVTMLDLIKKELIARNISFEYLTGQTKDRASKVNEFQNNKSVRVFLISLKAGGIGLNLTEADYIYLVDPWWNPAVENQAIDRSYRIGQKKNVIAVRLICPDTLEEKIMKMQSTKLKLSNDLIKSENALLKSFSKTDLIEMLK